MAAMATAVNDGNLITVTVTDATTGSLLSDDVYAATPVDGRSPAQWLADCQAQSLQLINGTPLGDGGPDATVAIATEEQLG